MSLVIDVDKVSAVLLPDGWYTAADWSFTIDAYEYVWGSADNMLMLGGGQCNLVPSTGFSFTEESGAVISGPLTAVLAVRQEHEQRATSKRTIQEEGNSLSSNGNGVQTPTVETLTAEYEHAHPRCRRCRRPADVFGPCPVCGQAAVLVRSLDRWMHVNGSDNHACWLALLRGHPVTEEQGSL